jgi:glycosyltransferase involved in cell wall biosynthesis
MFMQSQTFFGADSAQHGLIMRNLDRRRWRVHVACNAGERGAQSSSLQTLLRIPDVHVRPTDFQTGLGDARSKSGKVLVALRIAPSVLMTVTRLARYVHREHIKIVHCTEKPRDAFLGYVVAKLGGARCIIHVHVKADPWISPMVRWAMRRAELIAISEFVRGSLIEMGYSSRRIHVALNSLDVTIWNDQLGGIDERGWSLSHDGAEIRGEFGIPASKPLLLSVSRLNPWKGHLNLVRALGIVRHHDPNFVLLIVGESGTTDPSQPSFFDFDAINALISQLGLRESVIFTGYRRDVPRIMAACDVYTMPSFEEPFGMVYLEAMALAKPVISIDNGGTPEVVLQGETGLLSPPGDIEALAMNIQTLLDNPELRAKMGEQGRARVVSAFNPARLAGDVERIYETTLAAGRSKCRPPSRLLDLARRYISQASRRRAK